MPESDLLTNVAADGRTLLASAETDWTRPVPSCPDWDAADLVRHVGGVLAWQAAIIASGERVSRRDLAAPPDDVARLPAWYTAHLDTTVGVLSSTDPDAPAWTFSSLGVQRVGWWQRRLPVEIAVHRWDAQTAAGGPADPIDGEVASEGIAEYITEFLPGLLARSAAGPDADTGGTAEHATALTGTLHLHATDGPAEWWVDLAEPGAAVARHGRADTALRGTRSDLLLWLTNRLPASALDLFGRPEIAEGWTELRF